MEPKALPPSDQPFLCGLCNIGFATGDRLARHMQEKHEPQWTNYDRALLNAFRIKVD